MAPAASWLYGLTSLTGRRTSAPNEATSSSTTSTWPCTMARFPSASVASGRSILTKEPVVSASETSETTETSRRGSSSSLGCPWGCLSALLSSRRMASFRASSAAFASLLVSRMRTMSTQPRAAARWSAVRPSARRETSRAP
ncbi:hypothetical protein VTN02DRAFT_5496 [Thermoascus thermophilus]